jgi:hypothetical protein
VIVADGIAVVATVDGRDARTPGPDGSRR